MSGVRELIVYLCDRLIGCVIIGMLIAESV